MNVFQQAVQKKLRIPTPNGVLTTEDLFDLSLEQLDRVYRQLTSRTKSQGEGLIQRKADDDTLDQRVVAEVFAIVKERQAAAARRAENRRRKQKLLELLEQKQVGALEKKSEKDLRKLIDGIDEELDEE